MTPGGIDAQQLAALDRVREAVLARSDLAAVLSSEREPAAFAALLAEIAQGLGAGLTAENIAALLSLPPLGPAALPMPLRSCAGAPAGWRPVDVDLSIGAVEWAHLGDARADGGFYYDETQRAQRRPFNRLFRFQTSLEELATTPPEPDALVPSGLIFHMSYCGSTLVSRMLAAADAHLSIGEPQPLDAALRLCAAGRLPEPAQLRLLRAVAAALGRPRRGETRYFLKLDAWHIGLMPLIRRAFPAARWVFLYRDPLEVLQAQVIHNGLDPMRMPLRTLGIEWDGLQADARLYAAALASICEIALASDAEGGLFASYAELPAAVATRILPHFGVQPSAAEIAEMAQVARQHAKSPSQAFVPDAAAKRAAASSETRAAVEGRLAQAWTRLEAARGGG